MVLIFPTWNSFLWYPTWCFPGNMSFNSHIRNPVFEINVKIEIFLKKHHWYKFTLLRKEKLLLFFPFVQLNIFKYFLSIFLHFFIFLTQLHVVPVYTNTSVKKSSFIILLLFVQKYSSSLVKKKANALWYYNRKKWANTALLNHSRSWRINLDLVWNSFDSRDSL